MFRKRGAMDKTMSIVIPVYNRAKELPRTVLSIVEQQYRPIHLILVDNNSTDNSFELCHRLKEQYQDEELKIDVLLQKRPGASAARNMGLDYVSTRYMMFFDSDDILHPDSVSRYMQAFAQHPEADIIASTIQFHNGEKLLGTNKTIFTTDVVAQILHCIISTARFAAPTELIRHVGGWQEEYNGWEDWNLGVRLMLHTSRIHWLKHPPVATVYIHNNSLSARTGVDGFTHFYTALQYTRRDIANSLHERKQYLDRYIIYRQVLLASHILREARRQHSNELRQLSRKLYREAMNDSNTTLAMRLFFPLCLQYASLGGRGSGYIAQFIIG